MKCQNCGKYEANFHYRSSVNGQVTEQHLCQECAANMEGSVFARTPNEMVGGLSPAQSFFSPEFMLGGSSLWDNMTSGFFSDFWSAPQILMINPQAYRPSEMAAPNTSTGVQEKDIPVDAGDKFKKRREINRLRSEMKAAVKDENFERAAELRDQIYKLEKESKQD